MQVQNSELQKALWEEFSLSRLLIMPVLIGLLALALYLAAGSGDPNASIRNMAQTGFYVVAVLWGCYQAVHAVPKEVRHNTWDNLRLSPISPWSLVLGKLFGSTLYQWYGASILLLLYFFSTLGLHGFLPTFATILCLIGTAVLSQSVGMLASLLPLQKQNNGKQLPAFGGFIASLLVSSFFYTPIATVFYSDKPAIVWYGHHVSAPMFIAVTLCLALFWVFCALYRIMRGALQLKTTPCVWASFVIFSMIYFPGFIPETSLLNQITPALMQMASGFTLAFFIGLSYTYLNFFMDNLSVIRYRAFFNAIQQKDWQASLYVMPLWMVSLGLTIVTAVSIMAMCFTSSTRAIVLLILTTLLFTIRDGCILHYFSLMPKERLPHFAAFCSMFLLYGLIPGLGGLLGLTGIKYIFFPNFNFPLDGTIINLLAIFIQLFGIGILLKRRYQHLTQQIESSV